jgi:hypothetical protein
MAKRRRIPPWVVLVAFAVFTGTAIAALAYLRRPTARPMYCLARTPNGQLLHSLVEHGGTYGRDHCELLFRPRAAAAAPIQLRIVSGLVNTNARSQELVAAYQQLNVHNTIFDERGVRGSYIVRLDGPKPSEYILVFSGKGNETIEVYADARVFELTQAIELAADIAHRVR